jgi:hypothetical protein
MKTKCVLTNVIISLASLFLVLFNNGCTKEPVNLDQVKYDQPVLSQDEIENIEYVEFFELAKGDTIPKGIFREKPMVDPENEIIVLFSTEEIAPKATGNSTSTTGYICDLKCSIRDNNDAPETWPGGYYKIPVDLNEGAGGKYIYLYYMKNDWPDNSQNYVYLNVRMNCCTAPFLVDEPMIKTGLAFSNNRWTDLNEGAGGYYIKLEAATKISVSDYYYGIGQPIPSNFVGPIKDILIISSTSSLSSYSGWTFINADLNKGAGGKYIYLCYRKGEAAR